MSYGNPPGGYGPPQGGGYGPPGGGGHDPRGYGAPPPRGTNGMAVAALIAGISGLLLCGVPSLVGVILGHVSMKQIKGSGEEGRGMAVAGLVLSYLGVILWTLFLWGWFWGLGIFAGWVSLSG